MLIKKIKRASGRAFNSLRHIRNVYLAPMRPSSGFEKLPFSALAAQKLINEFEFLSVLDVGSGSGLHSKCFANHGKQVTAVDFGESIYFEKHEAGVRFLKGDYYEMTFPEPFDAVWASHVLEHQPNPNLFIKKLFNDCRDGGIVCITVPPLKHEIVGGHLTLWNAGLLLYHLVFAGYDCRNASILKYGYNISILVRKIPINNFPTLAYDSGDITAFLDYLPDGFSEPFDGNIAELNW